MVRAKFKVEVVTQNIGGYIVELAPVMGTSEENKRFYKYTPGGKISLSTINEEAAKNFMVGKEYYVDFIGVDA